jgi:hypothetical protein
MTTVPPATPPLDPGDPGEPGEPSNRWPWVALALGVLIIVVAGLFYLFNRPRTVNINVEGTATANTVARAASPPATLVPPTLPASATLAPTATPLPSPTPQPSPTNPPATPTPPPAPPTAAPAAAAAPPDTSATAPAQSAPPPIAGPTLAAPALTTPAPAGPPTNQPTNPPTPTTPPASPTPTPFAGQVAAAGGLGNTRSDLDTAYGTPAGETPEHLVVYRKGSAEYHVSFVPDPQGRAALTVEVPGQGQQPWALDAATSEARKLLPRDAQPPNAPQEGNEQFVAERYTSATLAQALPAQAFTVNGGQPGQFMVVYVKDPQQGGRVTRIIVGAGNDPQALMSKGR